LDPWKKLNEQINRTENLFRNTLYVDLAGFAMRLERVLAIFYKWMSGQTGSPLNSPLGFFGGLGPDSFSLSGIASWLSGAQTIKKLWDGGAKSIFGGASDTIKHGLHGIGIGGANADTGPQAPADVSWLRGNGQPAGQFSGAGWGTRGASIGGAPFGGLGV
jgi:hypothetical protein